MSARDRALALIPRKESLETELSAQYSILSANQSTMNTPLVDSEGFPRADIDVYAVRHARVRVIEIQNDLKALVDDIANALAAANREGDASSEGDQRQTAIQAGESDNPDDLVPFARVDGVAPNSPAASAGLKREDQIIRFGTVTATDFRAAPRSLQPLAALVAAFENRPLDVVVRREGSILTLNFTPRAGWGGRGLLGCHIVPVL